MLWLYVNLLLLTYHGVGCIPILLVVSQLWGNVWSWFGIREETLGSYVCLVSLSFSLLCCWEWSNGCCWMAISLVLGSLLWWPSSWLWAHSTALFKVLQWLLILGNIIILSSILSFNFTLNYHIYLLTMSSVDGVPASETMLSMDSHDKLLGYLVENSKASLWAVWLCGPLICKGRHDGCMERLR